MPSLISKETAFIDDLRRSKRVRTRNRRFEHDNACLVLVKNGMAMPHSEDEDYEKLIESPMISPI